MPKKENIDYVECPKGCGPSGSMGEFFGLEKEDNKMWIPKSRVKEFKQTCKEIKEDLKENSKKSFNLKRKLIAKKEDKKRENPIKGGKGDNLTEKDVSDQELEWGIEIEKEHSPKRNIRKDISFDHLEEDKKYYTHLREMEKKYKKKAFNLKRHLISKNI